MWKARFYFILLGSMILIVELLFAFWGHQIVTKYDSMPAAFEQQQHKQEVESNNNKNNNRNRNHRRPPDGRFNGFPVFYHDLTLDKTYQSRPYSSVRCVGENYQGDDFSWMHRSCHFRFLCFNVSSREFEVYARPDDETLQSIAARRRPIIDFSASVIPPPRVRKYGHSKNYNSIGDGVSLGSGTVRHPKYNHNDDDCDGDCSHHVKETYDWFPTVVRSSPPERYYALQEGMIFVPFHSVFTEEEGKNRDTNYSAVWDDLFPIFTLLNMFQLASPDTHKEAFLMRYVPWIEWISNSGRLEVEMMNLTNDDQSNLQRVMDPFRPLMMRHNRHDDESRANRQHLGKTNWTSQIDAILMSSVMPTSPISPHENMQPLREGLVCAKDGVSGLGPHGIRSMNGKSNMNILHRHGKGNLLWLFRNYCVNNLGLSTSKSSQSVIHGNPEKSDVENTSSTIRIIFSAQTSMTSRSIDGTHLQFENNIVDFTPIEIGLRDFLSSSMNRDEGENDKNVIIGSNNHRRAGTGTTSRSRIEIESHGFSKDNLNMKARIKLMMNTTVFIATCSDTTATAAIFLPRGASLIVFYNTNNDSHEVDSGTATLADGRTTNSTSVSKSALVCLDYRDLLNNLSHVIVHWLPVSTIYSEEGRKALFDIVKHVTTLYNKRKKIE